MNHAAAEAYRMAALDGNVTGEELTHITVNNASSAPAGTLGSLDNSFKNDSYTASEALAKELFLENYRLHYQLATNGRLLIRSKESKLPGNWILPGYVMRLVERTKSEKTQNRGILDFFVTQVVHSVDCQNNQVSTQLGGSYIHEIDAPDLKAIKKGVASNVMYTPATPKKEQ
jgi:hypothetical protein